MENTFGRPPGSESWRAGLVNKEGETDEQHYTEMTVSEVGAMFGRLEQLSEEEVVSYVAEIGQKISEHNTTLKQTGRRDSLENTVVAEQQFSLEGHTITLQLLQEGSGDTVTPRLNLATSSTDVPLEIIDKVQKAIS